MFRLPNTTSSFATIVVLVVGTGLGSSRAEETELPQLPPAVARHVDFTTDIQPIFAQHCLRCHGPERPKGGLRLDNAASAWRGGYNGPVILFGNSSNSPLIHLVSQIDPLSVMPPPGEGEPLTSHQVALLRAWIDQGAWWGEATETTSEVSIAPALQFTAVRGNHKQFAEHYGQREGWRLGAEAFSVTEQLSPTSRFSLSGRVLTDDYRVALLVEKQEFGFYRFGFAQYREYDTDTGGFAPLFTTPEFSLNRDLHLDIGRVWTEFGLTLPDWPRLVLGYEYQFRHGDKSTLQWGTVSEGGTMRAIYPAAKFVDEKTHLLKLDVEHTIAGWQVSDSFRAEWTETETRRRNVRSVALDVPDSLLREDVQEGWKSFQGANTFRIERAWREWLLASGGYLYSHLSADADFSLDFFNPAGAPVSGLVQNTAWRSQRIVLKRESHVGNLNLLLGPWQSSTLAFGVQGEWTRQNGTVEGTQTDFIAPPFNGPPFNLPDIVNPLRGLTDLERAAVDESLALRINRLPFTTLFAEARLQQEQVRHAENVVTLVPFNRHTEATTYATDLRIGFDSSPLGWIKFGSHYRWRDKGTDYDDGLADGNPSDLLGYPTLIAKRDLTTHEIVSRLTVRPVSQFQATLTHRLIATDYRTTTEPVSFGAPGDASPGGRTLTGNYDAHIVSLNCTLIPHRRFHAFTTISFHDTRTRALHDNSLAVVPYRGETWSLLCHGRFVLTPQSDLTAGYSFSTADFRQEIPADGLAVGARYDRHGVQFGWTKRWSEQLTSKLQYGFYQYDEPTFRGANNYTAHALFLSVHWQLN